MPYYYHLFRTRLNELAETMNNINSNVSNIPNLFDLRLPEKGFVQ
jgi:hypothetical protein